MHVGWSGLCFKEDILVHCSVDSGIARPITDDLGYVESLKDGFRTCLRKRIYQSSWVACCKSWRRVRREGFHPSLCPEQLVRPVCLKLPTFRYLWATRKSTCYGSSYSVVGGLWRDGKTEGWPVFMEWDDFNLGHILILRCLGDGHVEKSYHLLVSNPKWQAALLAFPTQNLWEVRDLAVLLVPIWARLLTC